MARTLMMLLTVVLVECVAAVVFGRIRLTQPPVNATAEVALATDRQDFGEVPAGPPLIARFPIENHGARRLVLTELDRSCDCIRGERPEIIVGPGSSGEIRVRLATDELCGPMQLALRYATNDPALPMLTVQVLADVKGRGAR